MKKKLSIFMAGVMLITAFFSFEINAFAGTSINNAALIGLGTAECSITKAGTSQYYCFTPSQSGVYRFYSEGNYDTYGYILNEYGSTLEYNDDAGIGSNFYMERQLYAGTKYYFKAEIYKNASTKTGTFKIVVGTGTIKSGYSRCSVATAGASQLYRFVPSQSGTYRFYSEGNSDTHGYLLRSSGDTIDADDDAGNNYNFYIEMNLNSDTEYYFKSKMHSDSATGTFNVFLERVTGDSTNPTGSVSMTNNVSGSQTVTFSLNDNAGVAGYYFGANSDYRNNTYTSLSQDIYSKPKSATAQTNVSGSGNWYLTVRDINGNVSQTYSVFMIKTTLNAQGGNGVPSYVITKSGNSFILPTPSKTGYMFQGWASGSSQSSGITGTFKPSTNSTLYATWTAGMRTTVYINYGGHVSSNYFTPPESGVYNIYSSGSYDTYGELYDNNSQRLKYDDDAGDDNNYFIKRYLVAGRQYRVDSKLYDSSKTGAFTLTVEKGSCSHGNLNRLRTVSPTCTAQGYSVYECLDCGYVFNRDYRAAYGHNYVTTTTKATTGKNGSVITKCARCGSVKSKSAVYYPKTIALSATYYTYDGKVKKPSVSVKGSNGKAISSKYYTVTYSNGRKNIGQYTVAIKFKGNYSGTVRKTFIIRPKGTNFKRKKTAKKGQVSLEWGKVSGVTGYKIEYSTDSHFKKNVKTTNSKSSTTRKTITKLKSKKTYYFRIYTYKTVKVNGKNTKIYSKESKAIKIKVK